MTNNLIKRTAVYFVATCLVAQPVFADVQISSTPLGSEAGATVLPNLLFVLDDSGSMAWDYNPDFVNDNNTCMTDSGGNTSCNRGAPPFEAGGELGFNQVGYDPKFTYLPGLDSTGQPILNPPSGQLYPATSLTPNAYLGGSSVNLATSSTDMKFCNSASTAACKRSGADANGVITVATTTKDPEGNALAAGQFPYRANVSSGSTINFGMPEMMTTASFTLSSLLVTATTIGKPSLTTSDTIYVTTSNAKLNTNSSTGVTSLCVAVKSVSANGFTYSTAASGSISTAVNGSYRKCDSGTWSRSGSTVTVTRAGGHNLQANDQLLIDSDNNNQDKLSSVATIAFGSTTTFTYTGSSSGGGASSGNVSWVRTGLYNVASTPSGPPVSYWITPVEYCSDVNLTDCVEVIPPATPTAPYTIPAYVRYCRSQAEATAPGAVTFIPGTPNTPRCQLKYVNMTGLTVYKYPRFGRFNRDTITLAAAPFANRAGRSDCTSAPPTCSYQEEMENYARWYAYYRTRMQMMKTSAGRAFLPFVSAPAASPPKPDKLRVGFITINPTIPNGSSSGGSSSVLSSKYLRIDAFNGTQAGNWYTKFYAINPAPSTPLRLALSRAGWIFAGKLNTGLTTGIPTADDPVQASCQRNYTFLTTDGFWNQGTGQNIVGGTVGNQDNLDTDSRFNAGTGNPNPYLNTTPPDYFSSRASGTTDGAVNTATAGTTAGGSDTLADIALYYYRTDLRGGVDLANNATGGPTSPNTTPANQDVATNNVQAKTGAFDFAQHQHMNTFTIGLADGLMRYQPDYDTSKTGDFANIQNNAAGKCFWNGVSNCNWPLPQADGQSALDDLWHAAVNGRGKYFSAMNPKTLANGLTSALNSLEVTTASAAAAATSSPQVKPSGTMAFSTTYQTDTWSGDVFAQAIDPATGDVPKDAPKIWEAQKLLLGRVQPSSDSRNIFMIDLTNAATKLKSFTWSTLTPGREQSFFTGACASPKTLGQCGGLTAAQISTLNTDGSHLVNWLRGQTGEEITLTCDPSTTNCFFRQRTEKDVITNAITENVLGDSINAQPLNIEAPFLMYENETTHPEPAGETYATFKSNNANRVGPLLIAANDGYLHAFDPNTGIENWAYAPKFLMPALYQLADTGYQHRYFADGSPESGDVFDTNTSKWRTIVVAGANDGGRGYYALDVTDPLNPKGLWEFCATNSDGTTNCPTDLSGFSHTDPDLGLTYGNPVIGRRALDGRWVVVVTSGLNNTNPGSGQGYFYVLDAITGQILHKVNTGAGGLTAPSGLMKIGGYYPDGADDPNFTHVYGGDQLGNVWRLDMSQPMLAYPAVTTGGPVVMLMATLKDGSGRIQPLTARPVGTHIGTTRIYYIGTGRYLGNADLTDPGASGVAWQQTIYGIRDQLDNPSFTPNANFRNGTNVVPQFLASDLTITKNPVDWTTKDGFFVDLNAGGTASGERVMLDLRLIQGTLIVSSTIPSLGGACVAGGDSRQYDLDFRTGGYIGNLATKPVGVDVGAFLVGTAIIQLGDNSIKGLNQTITGDKVLTKVNIDSDFTGKRFSYRER